MVRVQLFEAVGSKLAIDGRIPRVSGLFQAAQRLIQLADVSGRNFPNSSFSRRVEINRFLEYAVEECRLDVNLIFDPPPDPPGRRLRGVYE